MYKYSIKINRTNKIFKTFIDSQGDCVWWKLIFEYTFNLKKVFILYHNSISKMKLKIFIEIPNILKTHVYTCYFECKIVVSGYSC